MHELNVTIIPPKDRHPLIFTTFDGMKKGEAFVLVNDHDPKPLYYSFLHEREGLFAWEYRAGTGGLEGQDIEEVMELRRGTTGWGR